MGILLSLQKGAVTCITSEVSEVLMFEVSIESMGVKKYNTDCCHMEIVFLNFEPLGEMNYKRRFLAAVCVQLSPGHTRHTGPTQEKGCGVGRR